MVQSQVLKDVVKGLNIRGSVTALAAVTAGAGVTPGLSLRLRVAATLDLSLQATARIVETRAFNATSKAHSRLTEKLGQRVNAVLVSTPVLDANELRSFIVQLTAPGGVLEALGFALPQSKSLSVNLDVTVPVSTLPSTPTIKVFPARLACLSILRFTLPCLQSQSGSLLETATEPSQPAVLKLPVSKLLPPGPLAGLLRWLA